MNPIQINRINRRINEINQQMTNSQALIDRLNQLMVPLSRIPDNLEAATNNLRDSFTIDNVTADNNNLNNTGEIINGMQQRIRNQVIPELRRNIDQLRAERERLNTELLAVGGI